MRRKLLDCSLAACLLALAAWLVQRSNSPSETGLAFSDQGAGPQASPAGKIPEKYRETAYKGLEFLAKHQFPDGHWEADGGKHPVAMTGLVGLALLMEMERPTGRGGVGGLEKKIAEARHAANIRKAADWLVEKSQPGRDGLIFSEHASETARYMEAHGLATLFLAGVCRDESDTARQKKLTEVLTRAVKYIGQAQSSQGGWYHTSKVEGHDLDVISVTAIQIQALQAAGNAGIAIPGDAINGAQEYLKMGIGRYENARPDQNSSRASDTAAALACRFDPIEFRLNDFVNTGEMNDEWCKKWMKYCQAGIPVGRNTRFARAVLAHYYYAQTLHRLGGDAWAGYRAAMFDHLQSSQNNDGSWPPGNGISVGPIHSTAVWCAVLQLDNGSHPARRVVATVID